MGGGNSKQVYLPYEEAIKRVTDAELKRLKDAFKRFSTVNGYMTKTVFIKEVLGDGVPTKLAEQIYTTFGGNSKGLGFKDLMCGLVMLTRGKNEEKYKFIFGLYADENLSYVHKANMDSIIVATEGQAPQALSELFRDTDRVGYELFKFWLLANTPSTSISRWLLKEPCTVTLSNDHETPTFYQTLAGVTHLEENDIIELEKRYWVLKSQSSSGKFDLDTFQSIVCPSVPKSIVKNLFLAFDENCDNHIDFKEMACGISACCRGPLTERQKFCFKVFDDKREGLLDKDNLEQMIKTMLTIRCDNKTAEEMEDDGLNDVTPENLALEILNTHDSDQDGKITQAEYLVWTVNHSLPADFLDLLFQICHVVLGLKPQNKSDEGRVIIGWLERAERKKLEVGQSWYLISMSWWQQWLDYVNYQTTSPNEGFNNNVKPNDGYKKSSQYSIGTALCPTLGRKYSTGSISNEDATEVVGVTYSTLQYRDHKRLQESQSVTSSPTKFATLPRTSTSVHSSPLHQNHSTNDMLSTHSVSAQNTPTHHLHTVSSTVSQLSTGSYSSSTNNNNNSSSRRLVYTTPQKPSQVDNSPLVITNATRIVSLTNEGGRLKRDRMLSRGRDFELVPEAVWKALLGWYGGGPAIPRTVITPKHCTEPELELYPIYVKLLRHQSQPQRQAQATAFTGMMGGIGGMIPGSSGLSAGGNQPQTPRRYLAYTSCFSRKHTVGQIYDFIANRLRISKEDIRLWISRDEQNMNFLEDESLAVEDVNLKEESQILIEVRNKDLTWPEELSLLAKNKAVLDKGPTTTGVTGLSNLGNTCFMNAAVQCVSNTRTLTMYFKGGMHLYELNRTNPLGMKGHIAQRYGELLKELWSGQTRSLAPLKLRWTIGKYAPRFSGFQQHDCQELLAFLLDGLHEDLNRVHNRPYVELKDSDGRPDQVVAKEAWDNHMQRNKSIIVDLFHGQLKSEVRCRECGHTSVRFDPFTYLSLPLPMESCIHIEITVMRLDGSTPVKYGLRMNMEDKYRCIKQQLSELSNIPVTQVILVEVFGALIKSYPHDMQKIKANVVGNIYAYEIPAISPIPTMTEVEEKLGKININNNELPDSCNAELNCMQQTNGESSNRASEENFTSDNSSSELSPNHLYRLSCTQSSSSTTTTNQTTANIKVNGVIPSHNQSEPSLLSSSNQNNNSASSDTSVNQNGITSPQHTKLNGQNSFPANQNNHLPNGSLPNGSLPNGTPTHQRNLSNTSSVNSSIPQVAASELPFGLVVAMHRKMMRMDIYFLSSQKTRPSLFGTPLILPCDEDTTHQDLYRSVWEQVGRLVSPMPPTEGGTPSNHALDCDDSMGYEYPFILKVVQDDGFQCAWCPWYRFCRGCKIECNEEAFKHGSSHLAIDWEPTALHLRYQSSQERVTDEHSSVAESRKRQSDPINLDTCLEAFTREEQLGEDELWYCSKCKKHQLADKKLQIWKLPPILIIHLKRFQFLNTRWVKSQKIVKFPFQDFDPSNYLVSRQNTIENSQSDHRKLENASESTNHNTEDKSKSTNGSSSNTKSSNEKANQKPALVNGSAVRVKENGVVAYDSKKSAVETTDVAVEMSEDTDPTSPTDTHEVEDYTNVRYDLYSMACHTGMLGGGHYVAYGKNPNNNWYCYNDSMCKEISDAQIDTKSAYILFYEQRKIDIGNFLPDIRGKEPDTSDIDDECESDIKKMCTIQ